MVGRGLRDDRRVGQGVDQQDTRRNGVSVPWVLEDGGEEDGGLGGSNGGDKSRVMIPKGQGRTRLGGGWVMVDPSLGG